jgi:CRISPR-associated protein Cmr4
LFGDDITIVRDDKFDRLVDDLHLPVIARNHLENGESQNLWYEQVIPRLTLFWSMCIHPANDNSLFGDKVLLNSETLVQIGANGSIGYGYCSFSTIKEE